MKKNNYYLMALSAASLLIPAVANAQDPVEVSEEAVTVSEFECDNTDRYYSSWRDNWFIQIGAGVNQPFVERGIGTKTVVRL